MPTIAKGNSMNVELPIYCVPKISNECKKFLNVKIWNPIFFASYVVEHHSTHTNEKYQEVGEAE